MSKGQKEIQDAPEKHTSLFPHLEQLAMSLTSPFTATKQYLRKKKLPQEKALKCINTGKSLDSFLCVAVKALVFQPGTVGTRLSVPAWDHRSLKTTLLSFY